MTKWSPQLQAMIDRHGAERVAAAAELHLEVMKKNFPSVIFVPNKGQWRACEAMDADVTPFHLGALMGNGVGKTCLLANILIGFIWGRKYLNPDWLGKMKLWDKIPKSPRIRLLCHADDMKEGGSLYDEIVQWFPKGAYDISKEGKQTYCLIRCDNGVSVSIRTHDQPVTAHAGPNMDIILANEPFPQHLYGENVGRLRNAKTPIFWLFLTPLNVSSWLFDQIVDGADGKDTVVIEASIWDNCRDIPGTRGVLPRENIEKLIAQWRKEDPDQAEARITGRFQHLSGRIYKNFDAAVHVIDEFEIPKNWPCSLVIDPHDARPPAVGFFAQDPLGNIYAIDEYPSGTDYTRLRDTGQTYDHHARAIQNRMKVLAKPGQWTDFVMDPNKGETKLGNSNQSIKKEYADRGIRCRTNIEDDLDFGHKKVQTLLFFDRERYISEGGLADDNHPRLFVFRRCRNIVSALTKYGFKPENSSSGRSLTSRVEQDHKDFADVVRYKCVSSKAYSNPSSKAGSSVMAAVKKVRASVGGE